MDRADSVLLFFGVVTMIGVAGWSPYGPETWFALGAGVTVGPVYRALMSAFRRAK